ncbi:hypothetical protein KSF78_0003257 [Schistosoma japonicum]|nr:hypothetical protein KSF78_0003257 [Schistosoma japonicum]
MQLVVILIFRLEMTMISSFSETLNLFKEVRAQLFKRMKYLMNYESDIKIKLVISIKVFCKLMICSSFLANSTLTAADSLTARVLAFSASTRKCSDCSSCFVNCWTLNSNSCIW